MESHMNFEYLCRVCAANTKGRNSVAECVYILKTTGLKDKIFKYLTITVAENDLLPKVLCKTCFRQVEQTASLSSIAKHTQEVFEDFVRHTNPRKVQPEKETRNENQSNQNEVELTPTIQATKTPENQNLNSETTKTLIDLSVEPKKSTASAPLAAPAAQCASPANAPLAPPTAPYASPAKPRTPPQQLQPAPEEVVVHVSVTEPFTQQTQRKMISASKRRESIPPDMRFAPKSIAQRAHTTKQPEITLIQTHPSPAKKISPPAVLNFTHGQGPPQASKITVNAFALERASSTISINNNHNQSNNNNNNNNNNAIPAPATPDVAPAPVPKVILGAQKRKSTKPLSVLRTNGQVSLLKKSQKPATDEQQLAAKTTSVSNLTTKLDLLVEAEAEELPDKIIIAATKNQKQQQKHQQKTPQKHSNLQLKQQQPSHQSKSKPSSDGQQKHQQQQTMPSAITSPLNPAVPNDILLGKVIRDADLLKLILKALKWPVNNSNMEAQMNRLRTSKFSAVMSDTNLLQDTDLTQLLGPYLAPVLLAAHVMQQQQQQQQQIAAAAAAVSAATIKQNVPIMPYKLPPETSVQLVPASPTDESSSKKTTPSPPPIQMSRQLPPLNPAPIKPVAQRKRTKVTTKRRNNASISLLKQQNDLLTAATARHSFPPSINIDVSVVDKPSKPTTAPTDADDQAACLLNKQKALLKRAQRAQKQRRSTPVAVASEPNILSNTLDIDFDLDDDIVLMEPDEPITITPPTAANLTVEPQPVETTSSNEQLQTTHSALTAFVIPMPTSRPLITRPIIKRRRTVIHRANADVQKQTEPTATATIAAEASATTTTITEAPITEEAMTPATPSVATKAAAATKSTTTTLAPPTDTSTDAETKTSSVKLAKPTNLPKTELTTSIKDSNTNAITASLVTKTNNALVKPTVRKPTKSALGQQLLEAIGLQKLPTSTSGESAAETTGDLLSTRESVQQIRAALKRSLKQAQEQRKRSKVEPVKQDADSTTKNVKETKTAAEKSDNNVAIEIIDLEEHIESNVVEQEKKIETDATLLPKTSELKSKTDITTETSRSSSQRRGRQRKEISYAEIDENDMKTIQQLKEEYKIERKSQNTESVTSTEAVHKDETTPRRRGRKRKEETEEAMQVVEVESDKTVDDNQEKTDITEGATVEIAEDAKLPEKPKEIDSAISRPKRVTKSNPKFYKEPVKHETTITARRSILTRSRNRN